MRNRRISRYLWEKHYILETQRRGIDQLRHSLQLANLRNLLVLVDGTPAHPLPKKLAGYVCRQCSFRTISSKMIQQHISESPTCFDSQAQGLKDSPLDEVWLQSWVREGVHQYWIVRNEPEPIEPTETVLAKPYYPDSSPYSMPREPEFQKARKSKSPKT